MSRFDFTLKYVPETMMRKVNGLSRRLDWKIGVENNNKNKKTNKRAIDSRTSRSIYSRKNIREKDEEIVRVVEKIKKAGFKILRDEE